MNTEKFRNFVYEVENIVDEFVIILLSIGAITVSLYSAFFSSQNIDFIQFGKIIFPWITMLGLMIISRELWLLNRKAGNYFERVEGEE